MIYIDKITRKSDLSSNESISAYQNWAAQQNYKAFETFYYFIKEVKPKRILEIGTSLGGFTCFLNFACKDLNIDCEILTLDINNHPSHDEIRELGIDIRIENVFSNDYESVSQYVIDFIQLDGTTIVLCDGGNKKLEFNVLSNYIKNGDFILGHDYAFDKEHFEKEINFKIWNWCELVESDIEGPCQRNNLVDYRRELFQGVVWTCKIKSDNIEGLLQNKKENVEVFNLTKTTFVTGLWNIRRDSLTEGWSRSFEHYLNKFDELLKTDINFIIFGDDDVEKFVWERRNHKNTQFIKRNSDWFKSSVPYEKIQLIRNNPEWYNQSGWLVDSTQAKLDMYNPLVMSKMFLLHDAKILDKFDSDEMYWIDAGITNTVHPGYFTHDKVQKKLNKYFHKFGFVCFPYKADKEIHGFSYPKINDYAGSTVELVGRGGFFGGKKESISEVNSIYYHTLVSTINDGFMGTEESIFSIMVYRYPELIEHFDIEDNGLLGKFFEDCKNDNLVPKSVKNIKSKNSLNTDKTALYVITFNSPNQLRTLIKSMQEYDNNFLDKPKKYILNNSTDRTTDEDYKKILKKVNFIKIDTESVDLEILEDLLSVVDKFETLPLIIFEINYFVKVHPQSWAQKILNKFTKKGYKKINLKECGGDGVLIPQKFN